MPLSRPEGATQARGALRTFDFRQSHRLSADQVRNLERLHVQWARLLSTYLTAYLRSRVICEVKDMSQGIFEDVIRTLTSKSVLVTLGLDPLPATPLLKLDGPLAHGMIDRLLGGSGEITAMDRALTEIDAQVLERGIPLFLESLTEAWSSVEKLKATVRAIEASPQFLRMAAPQDPILQVDLSMSFAGLSGQMTLILPYDSLKPVLPRLAAAAYMAEPTDIQPIDPEGSRRLRHLIRGAQLSLTAVLGEATVSVGDFLDLSKNDVLILESSATMSIPVLVEGKPKFVAQPFARGRRLAVKVTGILGQAEDGGHLGE